MYVVFLKIRQGFSQIYGCHGRTYISRYNPIAIQIPTVSITIEQCVCTVQWIESKMNLPTVRHSITKRRIERSNCKAIPAVTIGVIEQRVGTQPKVFSDRIRNIAGTCIEDVCERRIETVYNERPLRLNRALRKGRITPQAVQFSCEISRHSVLVFLRRGEFFSNGQESITIHVKPVVIWVVGFIACVERVKIRANVALGLLVKTPCTGTHPRFKTVGHSVPICV